MWKINNSNVPEGGEKCKEFCLVRQNGEEPKCLKCSYGDYDETEMAELITAVEYTPNGEGCKCEQLEIEEEGEKVCVEEVACDTEVDHCEKCFETSYEYDGSDIIKINVCGQCEEGYKVELDEENGSIKCVEDGSIAILLALATLLMMIF